MLQVGRGVWEATNKAIFADYFAYDTVGAFSNLIIQNGGASTICFFINAYGKVQPQYSDCSCTNPVDYDLQKLPVKDGCIDGSCPAYDGLAWTGFVFSLLSILGFFGASVLHAKGVKTWGNVDFSIDGDQSDGSNNSSEPLVPQQGSSTSLSREHRAKDPSNLN